MLTTPHVPVAPYNNNDQSRTGTTPCGAFSIILQHRSRPGELKAVWLACKSWKCHRCRVHLAKKWLSHLSSLINQAEGGGTAVYALTVDASSWAAARKAISRAGGSYVRIHARDGNATVMTDRPLPQAFRITYAAARSLVKIALEQARARCPISTSRTWKLPAPKKTGEWVTVCGTSATPEAIQEAADQLGAQASTSAEESASGHVTRLQVPRTVGVSIKDWLHELLTIAHSISQRKAWWRRQTCPTCSATPAPAVEVNKSGRFSRRSWRKRYEKR